MKRTIFVLGAAGYIGKSVVQEAVTAGWKVKALVRAPASALLMKGLGAEAVIGDAMNAVSWIEEARGCQLMVDLLQPKLPKRLSRRAIQAVARYRIGVSRAILNALMKLLENERPLFINVSGVDDLAPDADGKISHHSVLVEQLKGFAHIGVPVRKLLDGAGVQAVHVYLGTVYGPGKAFAETVIPGLIRRTMPIIGNGSNRMALIHVEDAARAIVHVCGQRDKMLCGSNCVISDGTATTQAEFMGGIAAMLKAKHPRRVPRFLATLLAGVVTTEVLSRECRTDISALQGLGFKLRYPDWRTGVPAMLDSMAC